MVDSGIIIKDLTTVITCVSVILVAWKDEYKFIPYSTYYVYYAIYIDHVRPDLLRVSLVPNTPFHYHTHCCRYLHSLLQMFFGMLSMRSLGKYILRVKFSSRLTTCATTRTLSTCVKSTIFCSFNSLHLSGKPFSKFINCLLGVFFNWYQNYLVGEL